MWRVLVLTISLIANATSQMRQPYQKSAASQSQIKFAIENKYDDTGPGAKSPEYAYRTYKTIEDVLISYLNDADTKLPDHERERAIAIAQGVNPNDYSNVVRQLPKTVEEYTGYTGPTHETGPNQFSYPNQETVYRDPTTNYKYTDPQAVQMNGNIPPKKLLYLQGNEVVGYQRGQLIKGGLINLAQRIPDQDLRQAHDEFDPNPRYSYSYGVHDKKTGDSKAAHEIRDGSNVRGFYTFTDADGKQRTVHYLADDKEGFRANVQRTY